MIEALHIAESGLKATQEWLDVISNNISNSQTLAFKKNNVQFTDMVRATDASGENGGADMTAPGMGTRLLNTAAVFSEGALKITQQPFDVAIQGDGFFEILLDNGELAYTRVGRFGVNNEGVLTTATGQYLTSEIQIPPDVKNLTIGKDGTVLATLAESNNTIELGMLNIAKIPNPGAMTNLGDGVYALTEASGEATLQAPGEAGVGNLLQGFLESSNVELVEEMTNLVLAQRAYQLNARLIQVADQVMETVNNIRR